MDLLLENISHEDFKKYLKQFYYYAKKKLNIERVPKIFFKRDLQNSKDFFGKTAYYDPDKEEIHLFLTDRHPKDVLRSFAHELIHHCQKLEGKNDDLDLSVTHDPAYASKDPKLRNMERDAFERGNMLFRDWTDSKKTERKKIMSETKKTKLFEGSKPDFLDLDKDGNKKKPMKQAAKQKNNKNNKNNKNKKNNKNNLKKKIQKKAERDAKEDMMKRTGGDMKEIDEQSDNEQVGAVPTNENFQLPYQQLFDEKERLLKKTFNKREDIIYQELIRRFIKK